MPRAQKLKVYTIHEHRDDEMPRLMAEQVGHTGYHRQLTVWVAAYDKAAAVRRLRVELHTKHTDRMLRVAQDGGPYAEFLTEPGDVVGAGNTYPVAKVSRWRAGADAPEVVAELHRDPRQTDRPDYRRRLLVVPTGETLDEVLAR